MHIEELTRKASLDFLAGIRLGRLACAHHSQPYVTPFYFAYHDQWIYSFSTVGQKIDWLRANPLACVEVDEITDFENWTSVVVSGRYMELTKTVEGQATRDLAHKLLQQHQFWWEPGYARTVIHGTPRPLDPFTTVYPSMKSVVTELRQTSLANFAHTVLCVRRQLI